MQESKSGSQTIECKVESCRFNSGRKHCGLDSIMVSPRPGVESGVPQDESMCYSYKKR